MTTTTDLDVALLAALRQYFPGHDPLPLAALLRSYGELPHHREPLRVRLAIVERCHGDPARISAILAIATQDYRDVLAAVSTPTPSAAEVEQDRAAVRELLDTWGKG